MNRIHALLLVSIFASATAVANPIALDFHVTTDGFRYSYVGIDYDEPVVTAEEVGAQQFHDIVLPDWQADYVDGPHVSSNSVRTLSTVRTAFGPTDMGVAGGLLSTGLLPSVPATSQSIYSELNASAYWLDYVSPIRVDRGGYQLDITISWVAHSVDEAGFSHNFNYNRGYSFVNGSLMSSVDDLGVFTEAMFYELLASPATRRFYSESVAEWTDGCSPSGACGGIQSWGYYLEGSFEVAQIATVAEPMTIWMFGVGGTLLLLRRRRHGAHN